MDYPVIIPGHLSDFIKALRKTRGLTQASLGVLLGLKQVRIAEIENNPGAVSLSQIHLILSALGVQMVLRDTGSGWTTPTSVSTTVSKQAVSGKAVAVAHAGKPPLKRRGSW